MINNLKLILFAVLILELIILSGCSSNKMNMDKNTIKGYITVVRNEPFARLAIKTSDNKVYILECDNNLEKELYNQQGNYFINKYSERKIEMNITVIKVEEAIKLEKENEGEN